MNMRLFIACLHFGKDGVAPFISPAHELRNELEGKFAEGEDANLVGDGNLQITSGKNRRKASNRIREAEK
jgi:hypothetical protein